jgi:dTDP-glucose 4,6-dehydratase
MKLLVTGGLGFIGSCFIKVVRSMHPDWRVVNLDLVTYAGNPDNLKDIADDPRYIFVRGDISDDIDVETAFETGIDAVVNFAAESHVDRSIAGSTLFVTTNVLGTAVLLGAAKRWGIDRFLQVSTDEVYGSLPPSGVFTEATPLHPNNPYSATKAAADHMALAYHHTFGMDVVITRSSNNYGPHQYPEKFIPLFITNAMEGKACPLYGDGLNIRDWLHVTDNCRGILAALEKGKAGEVYNLGGGNERPNIDVAKAILGLMGRPHSLIKFVEDRKGHDRRYAIDWSKAEKELGWSPVVPFQHGIEETVAWYLSHTAWIAGIRARTEKRFP